MNTKSICRSHTKEAIRVLSLDGGGMRGIYTATYLNGLLNHFAKRSGQNDLDFGRGFNLICGTSTGAIVGCALAVGYPLRKVVDMYQEKGPQIFPHRITGKRSLVCRMLYGRRIVRAGDRALRAALTEVFGQTTIANVFNKRGISLSIPTVDMSNYQGWVFKRTPTSGKRDDNYTLVDVCMASSAAPVYRSLAMLNDPNSDMNAKKVFADGGLWANNPVMVALTESLSFAQNDQSIEIFSIGSCPSPKGEYLRGEKVHKSLMNWQLGAGVAKLAISAQEDVHHHMARLLAKEIADLGKDVKIIRFPHKNVPKSMFPFLSMDDTRPEALNRLIEQANSDVDLTLSMCDDSQNEEGQMIKTLLDSLEPTDPAKTLCAT